MSTSSSFQGRSLGEGKFLIEVPARLREATLHVNWSGSAFGELDNEIFYRCIIDGREVTATRRESPGSGWQFALSPLDRDKDVQFIGYDSPPHITIRPVIMIRAVDEEGNPITEFYAGAQYTKNYPIAWVTWDDEGVRVENGRTIGGRGTISQIPWARIANRATFPRISSIDIDFAWWDSGEDAVRVNADEITAGEELRLYVAAKGYDVAIQTLPGLTEGEEVELTVVLKAR